MKVIIKESMKYIVSSVVLLRVLTKLVVRFEMDGYEMEPI